MAAPGNRPLSPHMQIWRWGPAMFLSILHRATGAAVALVGLGVLLWWLGALASGEGAYAFFSEQASSWYGMVVLVGISWSFFNHAASGIRHFVLDIGAGFELNTNRTWSILCPVLAVAMTAIFWALLLLR